MSTKCTLAYDDNFHLYAECFDDANVYLQGDFEFESSNRGATITIPLEIWEVIRKYSNLDISLAEKTDDEIAQDAENFVNSRMAKVEECKAAGQDVGLEAIFGSVVYGFPEEPVEEQIKNGIKYYTECREAQRQLVERIKIIKDKQRQ